MTLNSYDELELKEELEKEHKMRSDFQYALKELGVSEDMNIHQLYEASKKLVELGWDVGVCEIMEEIL